MQTKRAIITGASTGLGYALAMLMAQKGYHLGLLARRHDLLANLSQEIKNQFPNCRVFHVPCDVTQDIQAKKAIEQLVQSMGHVDIFIANAGVGASTPAWKNNWPTIKNILTTNVLGAIASLEAAKEIMLQQGHGHLVGISSTAGFRGLPVSSAYCASKTALTTYLESIRLDLKSHGICVSSIHPGYIHTPMTVKNKYMPFVITAEIAAQKIFRALSKKKKRYVFPWPLPLAIWILRHMPDRIYDGLIGFFKQRGVFKN